MNNQVSIDQELIDKAREITGLESDADLINQALKEMIDVRNRFADWMELRGKIQFAEGYDYKAERGSR